jgi:hypothetical protein
MKTETFYYKIFFKNIKDETEMGYTNWKVDTKQRIIPFYTTDNIKSFIPYNRLVLIQKSDEYIAPVKEQVDKFLI